MIVSKPQLIPTRSATIAGGRDARLARMWDQRLCSRWASMRNISVVSSSTKRSSAGSVSVLMLTIRLRWMPVSA